LYIGRIHLKGFKSFGGSHEIALSSNFTAVVGPNGSGKSNILDALRWVLGDGNPSRLRIVRQGDLLFQGSISLPPASSSEVMVHLREGNRVSTLRRRFTNDDGSTMFIDGRRIRLIDLDDIKRKWRLEGDRFAFISQGEVSEVIQQRPLQRRMHLEAIFGIDLYRKQREEAIQRLDVATLEMQRILTLKTELQTRKEAIADLVIRAREAKGVIDQLEREKSQLYWVKRARSEKILDGIRRELSDLGAQATASKFWTSGWRRALNRAEDAINSISEDRGSMASTVTGLERSLMDSRRKLFSLSTSLVGSMERRKALLGDIAGEKDRFAGTAKRMEDLERDVARAAEEENESSRSFNDARGEWEQYRKRVEERSDRIRSLREERAACEAALESARSRGKGLGLSILEVLGEISRSEESVKEARQDLGRLQEEIEQKRSLEEAAGNRQRDVYAAFQQAAASLQKLSREMSALEGEMETLRETAFTRVYPAPVQHLLAAVRLGRIDASPRPLADVISCPDRLVTALESFLGARQFLLFVKDIDEAGRCIAHLKARSAGRATFLPLESARARHPMRSIKEDRPGIVGWVSDLIGMESEWKECVLHVLGDLLIVESFDVARDLVREGFRGPAVTLEGDVFQPGGTISGGKTNKGAGAIEIRRNLQEKEKEAERLKNERSRLEEEIAELEKEERDASEKLRILSEERRALEDERRSAEAAEAVAARTRALADERREGILAALSSCGREYLEIRSRLEELRESSSEEPESSRELELVKSLEESRSRAEVAAERLETARRMFTMVQDEYRRSSSRLEELEKGLEDLALAEKSWKRGLAEEGRTYYGIWLRLQEAMSGMKDLVEGHSRTLTSRERILERSASATARMESLDSRIRQARQRLDSTEAEIAESIDMWEERFPYPGEENIDTRDYDRIRRSVRELEKSLREIGDVDLGVLSEDASLAERLGFLEEQLRDVSTGIDELRRLIEETDRQAGTLFSTSLKEIDRKFCDLFQRLFGGGEAHLRLSDDDNLWEAGVEVIARPPGKRPQHLAQLSGGEQSLSAISLLFAAMEVAGVPLAVLDEVDASLDEVNLRRFSELAKEYSRAMQLICMTHRRATMERADLMYGVTMSEPGLSQVVGVRVEDWE